MPLAYRLEDYARYRERVGDATYIDITRRTDPARIPEVWDNLYEVVTAFGRPWIVQIWTKDMLGVLQRGGNLLRSLTEPAGDQRATTLTAQITVTGLAGTLWEPGVPPDGLRHLPTLSELLGGPDHIRWRYDPIIPGVHRAERFGRLASQVVAHGVRHGIINFIAPPGRYKRVDGRLDRVLPGWSAGMPGYDDAWRAKTAAELVDIAAELGLSLACCAEGAELAERVPGLGPAACGDATWFAALSGYAPARRPYRGSRPGCGCAPYFDVGSYGHWSRCHRCAYCYAG
jgi:hypothetical protein